ncbi:MAG: aliphatic sulfonate ABC transporter substrate-binding protein [Cyanobacteriota bacterium]|nr:aliphatic sulfonate ABC transporter substrate-binding protein [Cyanobacteriota bacterium]
MKRITTQQLWGSKAHPPKANLVATLLATALVGVVSAGIQTSAQTTSSPQTIKLGYQRGGGVFPVAQERGELDKLLAAKNIKVEWSGPFDRCASLLQAIITNNADIGGCGDIPTISALAAGQPLCIGRVIPPDPDDKRRRNTQVILVAKDSPIKSIADLVGKKVAINTGGAGEWLLLKALEVNNVPKDKVERLNIAPPDALPALVNGQVDAWAVWEPYNTIAELEHGAQRIPVDLPPLTYSVMVVGRDKATQAPQAVEAALNGLDQETTWMFQNPDKTADYMVKQLKISPVVAKKVIDLRGTYAGNLVKPSAEDIARIQTNADWMLENKILPKKLDVASTICPSIKASN